MKTINRRTFLKQASMAGAAIVLSKSSNLHGGTTMSKIDIYTDEVVHPNFGGVGFHVFHHTHPITKEMFENVVGKRWREMNPSFARMNDHWNWDKEMWDKTAKFLLFFKETGTEIYMTTWNPKDTEEGQERKDYAKKVVDNLEYLIREKGATNIKYYCMTNELSLNSWGSLREDLPKFRDYHRSIYEELKARGLDVGLLATDASPVDRWNTIQWAVENMDDITAIYGGHHYINNYRPEDENFYSWFLDKMKWGAGMAQGMKKNFILGEFGSKQDGRTIDGIKRDVCIYWDTPQEPLIGIQLSEAVIAALNGGIYGMGYWTFMDFPDSYSRNYINKWGTFKWTGDDFSTRAHYYAYGLLTKFFRGPATVFRVNTDDQLLRTAALQHHEKGTYSMVIASRKNEDVPINIKLNGKSLNGDFRKYVYDPANVPSNPFGDLQDAVGKVAMKNGVLTDTVVAGTLNIYTTAYDEEPPDSVKGLKIERNSEGNYHLNWHPNTEDDFCYYRIYRSENPDFKPSKEKQIGSTIATEFLDRNAAKDYYYKILAVDKSGNVSEK